MQSVNRIPAKNATDLIFKFEARSDRERAFQRRGGLVATPSAVVVSFEDNSAAARAYDFLRS